MYIQEDDLKLNDWQFSQRKYLPYETKLRLTETRIREWHYNWDGQVYLMGVYSSDEKAIKATEMCRKRYQDIFTKGNCMLDQPKVFQFPADDEI